jgi:hypothetical protein
MKQSNKPHIIQALSTSSYAQTKLHTETTAPWS